MAVANPVPGSPMIRIPGIRQFSKCISRVGDPLIPSFRSLVPSTKPVSSACTTNAEIPFDRFSGSVTTITVYQLDTPALVIQHFVPFSTQPSPSATALVRMAAASEPASRSESAYEIIASPDAIEGSTSCLSSWDPDRMIGIEPSLLTPGINDDDAQTLASSSMTITVATASAPAPSYASGI